MTMSADLIAEAREWPLDRINEGWLINSLADALEAAEAKIAAVRKLHQPEMLDDGYSMWCGACSECHVDGTDQSWPCPTIKLLDGDDE